MNDYNDEPVGIEIELESAKWAFNETNKLFEEYKNCRTEFQKSKILNKLISMWQKMNYESKVLKQIIDEARNEGLEF